MTFTPLLMVLFGLSAAPTVLAQGCCSSSAAKGACTRDSMGSANGHEGHNCATGTASARPHSQVVLPEPVQAVFNAYIRVQAALAQDSVPKARESAALLAKAVRSDSDDLLPAKLSQEADALASAADLDAVRKAFKAVSASLIGYVNAQKLNGEYHEAYCGMVKASWLQRDTTITNPYMGKSMLRCGEFRS